MTTISRVVALLFALSLISAAAAAAIYRWIDEKGVTNVSDVVPEKYKKVAVKIDSAQLEPDERSRRDGVARAAAIASAAASGAGPVAAANARQGGSVATPLASRSASSASSASTSGDRDDCATLQRRYKESQDCFGLQPRTITGAINGARSPQCPVVVDPSPKCGLPDGGEGPPAPAP